MTIPLSVRKALLIDKPGRVLLEIEKKEKKIKIKKTIDFFDLTGTFKPKNPVNAVKIREMMEKSYERT